MTRVAAVLVTRDSTRWIPATLSSVLGQGRAADRIVVIDDGSTDGTPDLVADLLGGRGLVVASTSTAADRTTRIAQNFRQGLQEVIDCDIAVLGDHDDVWHPNRIGHQVGLLEAWHQEAMVASNGRLVDAEGLPSGGTLRDAFPVPVDWDTASAAQRMRTALRYSVATGGASAVRTEAFADLEIPTGWLHDRWWSLVAAAREGLRLDGDVVIDYRVSAEQQVGLDRGLQRRSMAGRAASGVARMGSTIARIRDLHGLAQVATRQTHPELSSVRLVRNLA